MGIPMGTDFPSKVTVRHRAALAVLFLVAAVVSCVILYNATDSLGFRTLHAVRGFPFPFPFRDDDESLTSDSEEYNLERVLMDASMPDNTVILTTLNEAWARPGSIFDLFLESFRIGEHTRPLLNHLVIITLDHKAFSWCRAVHSHCFALIMEGVDFSREAYFMTPDYLTMMWTRIDFLRTILEMGYNFVFTDADVMWFRNPFPEFYSDADFQIACDHFSGKSDDRKNKPNGGFKFVRTSNRSIEFYKHWYLSREKYPGLHDQDVLNRIKNDSFVRQSGLKIRFLDTALFGGFCEPSKDLNEVCTMHANCCFGLDSKLHDLRILIEDWKRYLSLPPRLKPSMPSWRVPQNCSLESLHLHFPKAPEEDNEDVEDIDDFDK
ncbi:uncharacterized protein At4g15970-like [Andrographis paniculata]|uniref:uncharacterized protein At4g15970-like n=1 Tax=Andrographis paniculata TaxID=175694 RepID=UPI0021E9825B|nr:uncharacterized protein At4g15970-like [Andrographis paniculata]